jgi:hypothetical protein
MRGDTLLSQGRAFATETHQHGCQGLLSGMHTNMLTTE